MHLSSYIFTSFLAGTNLARALPQALPTLSPAHIVCVSESDKLYRQVKLQKEASESLDQYQHKGERFSKEDNETSEGRFQTV